MVRSSAFKLSQFWCIFVLELLTAMPVEYTPPFGSPQGQVRCTARLVHALESLSELSEPLQFLAPGQPCLVKISPVRTGCFPSFIKNHLHQKPVSSKTIFRRKNETNRVGNIVRVCVKASPAEGRRCLHTNTAHARLSGSNIFFGGVPMHTSFPQLARLTGEAQIHQNHFLFFFFGETEMRKVRAVNNQNWASRTKQS